MAMMVAALVVVTQQPSANAVQESTSSVTSVVHSKPVPGQVARGYQPPEKRWLAGHRGVDLASSDGDAVHASAAGVVHFAGVIAGRPSISVMHADGIRTTYQPVDFIVQRGDRVSRGQVLGHVRTPELFDERGVHWGALRGETYLNPLDLLGSRTIVLKPVTPQ
ncbi:M23 family metallopeptidase [Corynebacterium sp. H113]